MDLALSADRDLQGLHHQYAVHQSAINVHLCWLCWNWLLIERPDVALTPFPKHRMHPLPWGHSSLHCVSLSSLLSSSGCHISLPKNPLEFSGDVTDMSKADPQTSWVPGCGYGITSNLNPNIQVGPATCLS